MISRELLAELESIIAAGLPCAVCTVVATRGSTPQKAGATMLVHATGAQSGTLGGGCVEAEVRRRALQSLANGDGQPTLHTFTLDDDYGWDDGLICGGRMTILVDVLDTAAGEYFAKLREYIEAGRGHTEIIAISENRLGCTVGARLIVVSGEMIASRHAAGFVGRVEALRNPTEPARAMSGFEDSARLTNPKSHVADGLAILPTLPRIRLLIVGGGHVGQAVARLAAEVEFDIWVLDDRESIVSAERFPQASRRIPGSIGDTLKTLAAEITPTTYCLIVTRGHNHDEEALFHLAPTAAGYVGMIGSRRKVKLIFDDLRAKGISDEMLSKVRAPVGLDIGSQTVNEIAVSIVAELIARRNCSSSPPS